MRHLWVRSETRANEQRVAITPDGARKLIERGFRVTVEDTPNRVIPTDRYREVGCAIVPAISWPQAPFDATIVGLKELPDDGSPLRHRHIMFGHAFKGQHSGRVLLERFQAGGGTLLDLEYLIDERGRRVAAFGYWAGFAGAAVALKCWIAQQLGEICGPVSVFESKDHLVDALKDALDQATHKRPDALIIGALGRVGKGAADLCEQLGVAVTRWDMAETASGGPFPEILEHDLFLNCILARPGTPVFVGPDALGAARKLTVVGDIACDPDSDYNPVPIYDRPTTWAAPALRVHDAPPLDVMAIDNLPSMLPLEASEDFAEQLLPHLLALNEPGPNVWTRAEAEFRDHIAAL